MVGTCDVRVFSNESVLPTRCPKYCSCSFSINPSNEYLGLISYTIDWFDLAVQGTLKSLLQHHSSKASILQLSAIFMVQLSHPYTTTGRTIRYCLLNPGEKPGSARATAGAVKKVSQVPKRGQSPVPLHQKVWGRMTFSLCDFKLVQALGKT